MILVLEGQVKIVLDAEGGQETWFAVLKAGDCFGELSLIDPQPRAVAAVATAPTVTSLVHREDFVRVLQEHPHVGMALLQVLAHRLRGTEAVPDTAFPDVRGRLAKRLLELAASGGTPGPEGTVIPLTAEPILMNATRASVNPHLIFFETHGIIKRYGRGIMIVRPDELKRWMG
jgi:CRP-like cAMP-binding protein